jgi:hypothetical protein
MWMTEKATGLPLNPRKLCTPIFVHEDPKNDKGAPWKFYVFLDVKLPLGELMKNATPTNVKGEKTFVQR